MKAMVLAAGFGERMRPLTETRAKPALPLLNRTLIVHTLNYLQRHGVSEVVINLHHQPDSIRGTVGDGSRSAIKVSYSEEPVILGTAGGLKRAEAHFRGSGSFVMINSDSITDCDLGSALKKHRESGALATMVLTSPRREEDYGVVEVDERDRIVRIAGRPEGNPLPQTGRYTFTGLHVMEPEILDAIPADGPSEINRDIYPRLLSEGKMIRAFVHSGFWRELGNPRLYIDGSIALLSQGGDASLKDLRASEGIYLDRVSLPPGTVTEPPILLGRGTNLGRSCSLLGGVISGRQVQIGDGCGISSSIIWDGARIGDGVKLTDCIVTSGVYVPPGVTLSGKIILRAAGYQGRRNRLERLGTCYMAGI
jgi:NDP-sugar pyrophosphorylase family protein